MDQAGRANLMSAESAPNFVSTTDFNDDIVIKQEPQDPIPDVPFLNVALHENEGVLDYSEMDEEELPPEKHYQEVDESILCRAVSPPAYNEDELMALYKNKYNLKNVYVKLEKCDRIWETLKIIKRCKGSDTSVRSSIHSESSMLSSIPSSDEIAVYERKKGRKMNNSVPDFRYTQKGHTKLFHCVTCDKKFLSPELLHDHAQKMHGVYVVPKRRYDLSPRESGLQENKTQVNENEEEEDNVMKLGLGLRKVTAATVLPSSTSNSNLKKIKETSNDKVIPRGKPRIKCVLCKRITTDILNHMKGYHKVGCLSSIIAQCETLDDTPVEETSTEIQTETQSINPNSSTSQPIKKRKRNFTNWTVQKKKRGLENRFTQLNNFDRFKPKLTMSRTFNNTTLLRNTLKTSLTCNVCHGVYKTRKTLNYHKSLHRKRGETPESFDPSRCRFLNSPLRKAKTSEPSTLLVSNNIFKPKVKIDQNKTNDINLTENDTQNTVCVCGRTFRNSHTLRMHKVTCKSSGNDSDLANGINIKIKKNKHDSYVVVPSSSSTPVDEILKESRTSKDSDASSNDSGMASVEEYQKSKSQKVIVMKQTEDDEEIDIEDVEVDSNYSNLTDSKESNSKTLGGKIEDNSSIPTLSSLCKKILSSEKGVEHDLAYLRSIIKSICPCGKKFKNFKYFNIHVKKFHPLLPKCGYCDTNFDKIEKYIYHRCIVMQGKPFIEPIIQTVCLKCEASVDIEEPFDKHMKTHSNDPIYFCFKCELTFENINERKLHFDKEHGFALCRICHKLLHIDYLSSHEAYHDGMGYPCHICKKTFSEKALLQKHNKHSHDPSVQQVVQCVFCQKSLNLRYLKKHLGYHLHSEMCKKCNKCYKMYDRKDIDESALQQSIECQSIECNSDQAPVQIKQENSEDIIKIRINETTVSENNSENNITENISKSTSDASLVSELQAPDTSKNKNGKSTVFESIGSEIIEKNKLEDDHRGLNVTESLNPQKVCIDSLENSCKSTINEPAYAMDIDQKHTNENVFKVPEVTDSINTDFNVSMDISQEQSEEDFCQPLDVESVVSGNMMQNHFELVSCGSVNETDMDAEAVVLDNLLDEFVDADFDHSINNSVNASIENIHIENVRGLNNQ
ncbi:hypothetical protein TKK_0010955 [Trichogramma kaykai]|uniref:C2H2-type domain-containing protein n=1 Tax=Trichogramma kaykai TaxID=54128 RepID=A0ABD2WW75_9HYME